MVDENEIAILGFFFPPKKPRFDIGKKNKKIVYDFGHSLPFLFFFFFIGLILVNWI